MEPCATRTTSMGEPDECPLHQTTLPFHFILKFLIKVAMVAMPREQTQTRGQCTRTQRRRCWEQGLRLAQHMAALERRICFTNNSNRDNDLLSRLTPPLMTQSQRASYCHLNKYSSLQRHPVCGSPLHSAQPISALVPAALPNGVLVHRSTRLSRSVCVFTLPPPVPSQVCSVGAVPLESSWSSVIIQGYHHCEERAAGV